MRKRVYKIVNIFLIFREEIIENMKLILTTTFILLLLFSPSNAQTSQWRPVNGSRQANISGMALIEHTNLKTTFLIVHDNKKKEQTHAAIITVEGVNAPTYTPIQWLGDDIPVDLEAVSTIPKTDNEFMAFTATGRVFHIRLHQTAKTIEVLKSFDVPQIPIDSDFEGFALQEFGNEYFAVWADRGLDAKPATLFWSKLNIQTYAFGNVSLEKITVPYPVGNTRHISDVKVDLSGAVFISSASDPGNDGPFASAIYYIGNFNFNYRESISLRKVPNLTRLFRFDYHKIEAIELVSGADGGMVFGTDDENLGAEIYLNY